MKTTVQIADKKMQSPVFHPGQHGRSLRFTAALMPPVGAGGNGSEVEKRLDVMQFLHLLLPLATVQRIVVPASAAA